MSDAKLLAPLVLDGWFVLHQFFRIDPLVPLEGAGSGVATGGREIAELFRGWEELGEEGWSGLYRIVGGETDLLALHFRRTLEGLGEAERALAGGPHGLALIPTGDYVSVVELGMYAVTDALVQKAEDDGMPLDSAEWKALVDGYLAEEREKRYVKARLFPRQPEEMPYLCFYPMDKRRNPGQNWYTLSLRDRARLMLDHGATGRKYAGRISQIISGSVGFDDWEWGVTLFAGDPLDFKALVTEMRYDEVSALYAEFGSFWVGHRIPTERIEAEFTGA